MGGFDPWRAAVQLPGGQIVRLGPAQETGPLNLTVSTVRGITYAALAEDNQGEYDLDGAIWSADPLPRGYAKQVMLGARAVFVPAEQTTTLTARVTTVTGVQRTITTQVRNGAGGYLANVQNDNVVRGPVSVPVEAAFGFAEETTCTARLVRYASPGVPEEATVIEERQVTFGAGETIKITATLDFPAAPGLGHGHEYRWVLDLGDGHEVASDIIPIWTLGDDPACAPVDPYQVPHIDRPAVFASEFNRLGQVTPADGHTYQDHVDGFLKQWKGRTFGANLPGAWLNFNAYNSPFFFPDLDDPEVPRHTVRHFDFARAGWTGAGWYGLDSGARPWPQDRVAVDVPIPHNARPAYGTDRALGIVATRGGVVEHVTEMWLARRRADGSWEAASCGRTYTDRHWTYSRGYTTQACGVSHLAGSLLMSEVAPAVDYTAPELDAGRSPNHDTILGHIPHPLSVAMPAPRSAVKSWPATYTDGFTDSPVTPAEGQFFGLRPDLTHDDFVALGLDPFHYVLAVVLQRRGAFCSDTTRWSAAVITEADDHYTVSWDDVLPAGSSPTVVFPDDWWVIGPVFADEAAYRAATGAA